MASRRQSGQQLVRESVEKQLEELYRIHDRDFALDKEAKQQKLVAKIVAAAKGLEAEDSGAKAFAAYAQGNALNALEAYDPNAEKLLSRAVKLDGSHVGAWNSLGTCFWKKGDLAQACRCFEGANKQSKNKYSERELSMLLRDSRLVPQSGDPKKDLECRYKNFKAAVSHAKSAVGLDFCDGRSWYYLGNAYLYLFFNVSHREDDLDKALKAYKSAERNGEGDKNPDLHFNRANVFKYQERYTEAAASYKRAMDIDPDPRAGAALEDMRRNFDRVMTLVRKRGQMKPKRLQTLLQDIPALAMVPHPLSKEGAVAFCDVISLSECTKGRNKGKAVMVKVVILARSGAEPPAVFLVSDKSGTVMPVSVYNLSEKATSAPVAAKAVITLIEPTMTEVNFGEASYTCLQISDPRCFLVNGKVLVHAIALPTSSFQVS